MSTETTHIDNKPSLRASHCEDEGRSKLKQSHPLEPALRFKEFEGCIEETLFGDDYKFHTTNSLSRDKLNYDKGEVRNIHYGDIHTKFQTQFHLANEYVPLINDDVDLAKIKEDSYCKVGDLVIADASEDYADIGKSIELIDINNEKLLAGLHTFLARPSSESTALGYMSFLLKSWKLRKQIMTIAQGTKVLSLSAGRVSNLKLNLPSLPEQQKIASFLSAIDKKIQQLTKKKALLEHYKKGVMQQLFSGQLRFKPDVTNETSLRASHCEEERRGKLKQSAQNKAEFPDWEEKQLSDVAKRVVRKNKENNLNVLTISAQQGLISQLEYFNKSVSAKNVTNYYLLHRDEFAYNKSYSTGYPMGAIKRLNRYDKGVVSTLYICFEFNDKVSLDFMEQYFEFGRQNIELEKVAQEGARNHGLLNIGVIDFLNIDIKVPTLPEQQKIATYLSSIDTKIESVNNQITQTQTFKKGLLQQMFV
ncbi:restriction endonuclease subunit S [Psychroflexus sp. MES1-P1E]|uniref:restriction endonuclease subunit S n=1 Tax=Psychroflexus sp. MES1-P1E TaxID=2058320 RepID=UPI000C79C910|nr:restriction endonuclease subunit S [Psychroflexus sp. MES1-P1E]PKG43922.1 restriction endonuclease subunit S [Psychroflexus sp. MES1-P1E]